MEQPTKSKLLNLGLLLSSLVGYLEWGGGQSMLIGAAELDVIKKLFSDPLSVVHPFILLPLAGQLLLLYTLFQKEPGKWPTYLGLGFLALLLLLVFLIGIMDTNVKMLCSAIPFIVFAVLTILHRRKKRVEKAEGV